MSQPNNAILLQHEGRLQLALKAYNSGQFRSHRAAASAFNVKHHTLSERAKGILFRLESPANGQKLTRIEEQTIVRYILNLHSHAFAPQLCEVADMANKLLSARGGTPVDNVRPSTPSTLVEEMQTKLFYTLHKSPKYIQLAASYRQHLTLDSYYVFEKIHDACKGTHGKVTFRAFFQQFGSAKGPTPNHVAEIWTRLLRDKSDVRKSFHRKPFVMAALYMLHVESSLDVSKMVDIDPDRRETLKRFSKWVPCQCKCGREWNFVNEIGLARSGDKRRECDLIKLFDCKSWTLVFKSDKVRKLEITRQLWEAVV